MNGMIFGQGADFKFGGAGAAGVSCPYSGSYTSVVNVTGSGMLMAVQINNNSPRMRIIVDGTTIIDENGNFATMTPMLIRFSTSLQVLGRAANSAGPAQAYAAYMLD